MKPETSYRLSGGKKALRWAYILTLFVMVLTGFGQMPIFKRYYISDIPGMGWLAKFYVTHYIHYLGAIFPIDTPGLFHRGLFPLRQERIPFDLFGLYANCTVELHCHYRDFQGPEKSA